MKCLSTILLVLVVLVSQAQSEKKGLKYYYKGKLAESEEEFGKIIRMFRFSALGHYGMALLYANPAYPKKDMYKAYDMMRMAVDKKKTIRPKKLEELKKYFTLDSIAVLDNRINTTLFEAVLAEDNWKYTKNFLDKCKASPHYADVQKLAIKQQYKAVKDTNTVASFNWFIRKYPDAKQAEEATQMRNDLAYADTKSKNTLAAYQDFLDNYPAAREYNAAEKIRNTLAYQATKKTNTIEAYTTFIEEYQDAKELAQAKEDLVALEFAQAKQAKTDEAWLAFLKKHPKSTQAKEAKTLREELAFARAEKVNTLQSYDYFMKKYENSTQYATAFNKKTALTSATFSFEFQEGAPPTSIHVFDRMSTAGTAVSHIKTKNGLLLLGKIKAGKSWKHDAWVILLNNDGTLKWERQLGTSYDDVLSEAIEVEDGYILAGYTKGKSSTDREVWVVKLDKNGKTLWERTAPGADVQGLLNYNGTTVVLSSLLDADKMHQLNLIQLASNGELKANKTHTTVGLPKGIVLAGQQLVVATNNQLLLIDSQLSISKQIQLPKAKSAFGLRSLGDAIFIVGRHYDYKKANKSDFYLAKYSTAGAMLWEKNYDIESQQDIAYDIAMAADGSLTLVGLTEKNFVDNLYIAKLSATGEKLSATTLATSNSERKPTVQVSDKTTILLSSGLSSDLVLLVF